MMNRLIAIITICFFSNVLSAQTPGSIDLSFNPNDNGSVNQGSNNKIYGTAIDENGKILLVGEHTMYNGQQTHAIVRIDQNGTIDPGFQTAIGIDDGGSIDAVAVQEDGKILIGGAFSLFGADSISRIARLNTDGTLDATFQAGSIIAWGGVSDIEVQFDGKILVGGGFNCSTYSSNSILRLNTDGTIDATFNSGTGFNSSVRDIHLLSNGQIIATGVFTQYNGSTALKVARLNANGTVDNLFSQSYDFQNEVDHSAILPDNKILMSGYGISPNNPNLTAKIVRLQPDGQLDTIWYFQGGAVQRVYPQPDGKILRIGSYINADYTYNYGVHRLLSDGSVDSSFVPNSFSSNPGLGAIHCLSEIIDGKVIVGGSFTSFNGISKSRVSRMYLCTTTEIDQEITSCDFYVIASGDTLYQSGMYIDTLSTALGCDSIILLNLTIISQPTIESSFSLPSDPNTCNGVVAVDISGNGDFTVDIDNGLITATSSSYSVFTNLCPGIHNLQIVNGCGDTLTQPFVIPVDSNYIFNNPFIDSIAVDSLGATIEDCEIYYNGIDTAYIDSIFANGNTVTVIWNIVDSNGSNFDTSSYVLNNGNGVYYLQLSIFCPTKALGDYFTVTEAIYFEDGNISTASLAVLDDDLFQLFPNPTNNLITIRFEAPKAELVIYDTQGKLVQTQTIQSGEGISLGQLETGIYFFELTTGTGRTVKRVVKQ